MAHNLQELTESIEMDIDTAPSNEAESSLTREALFRGNSPPSSRVDARRGESGSDAVVQRLLEQFKDDFLGTDDWLGVLNLSVKRLFPHEVLESYLENLIHDLRRNACTGTSAIAPRLTEHQSTSYVFARDTLNDISEVRVLESTYSGPVPSNNYLGPGSVSCNSVALGVPGYFADEDLPSYIDEFKWTPAKDDAWPLRRFFDSGGDPAKPHHFVEYNYPALYLLKADELLHLEKPANLNSRYAPELAVDDPSEVSFFTICPVTTRISNNVDSVHPAVQADPFRIDRLPKLERFIYMIARTVQYPGRTRLSMVTIQSGCVPTYRVMVDRFFDSDDGFKDRREVWDFSEEEWVSIPNVSMFMFRDVCVRVFITHVRIMYAREFLFTNPWLNRGFGDWLRSAIRAREASFCEWWYELENLRCRTSSRAVRHVQYALQLQGLQDYLQWQVRPHHETVTEVISSVLGAVRGKTVDTDCLICQEPYACGPDHENCEERVKMEAPVKLPCGHEFGAECIRRWLDQTGEEPEGSGATCPMCRTVVLSANRLEDARNLYGKHAVYDDHEEWALANQDLDEPISPLDFECSAIMRKINSPVLWFALVYVVGYQSVDKRAVGDRLDSDYRYHPIAMPEMGRIHGILRDTIKRLAGRWISQIDLCNHLMEAPFKEREGYIPRHPARHSSGLIPYLLRTLKRVVNFYFKRIQLQLSAHRRAYFVEQVLTRETHRILYIDRSFGAGDGLRSIEQKWSEFIEPLGSAPWRLWKLSR